MIRALPALALFALAGCSMAGRTGASAITCTTDAECGPNQLCYAEGCGDPGRGIVVEVGGDPQGGLYARDVPIADGSLGKVQDFGLGDPLVVTGEFQREKTGNVDPTNRTFYGDAVVIRALGQSELIPGISRSYEQRFDRPERGRYAMNTGAGVYKLTAWPIDPSVPPAAVDGVLVEAGQGSPDVTFAFPAVEGAVTISGRLLKRYDPTQIPNIEIALTGTSMDVQAFDPGTREPLSQRFPISSQGVFTITLGPKAKELPAVLFVVTPRSTATPTPSKTFLVEAPFPNSVTLELGDYGDAVEITGQVQSQAGAPVAQAQVVVEGTVAGGGTFRSRVALTDQNGVYTLSTLANAPGQSLSLFVIPPAMSDAAVTRVNLSIDVANKKIEPELVTCDDRLTVTGTVLTPEGEPARGVGIRAVEHVANVEPGNERPFPLAPVEVFTDANGAYELRLDPATWRLDFVDPALPLASRLVTVRPLTDDQGEPVTSFSQPTVTLAKGRTISGVVTGTVSVKADAPVPYSTVRFFRVTSVEGRPSAILLGSTVADDTGRYSIVLPTR